MIRLTFAIEKMILQNLKVITGYLKLHFGIMIDELDYEENLPMMNNTLHFLVESNYAETDEYLVVVQNPTIDYPSSHTLDIKVPYHHFELAEVVAG